LIVVDSSALIAILLNEAEKAEFATAILAADGAQMTAPNYFEVSMLVRSTRRTSKALAMLFDVLARAGIGLP
jgi:uncharacterized protein with PIN domain